MATPVIMPRQGQSVESCIFSEWFVNTGDKVKKGDLLFAYETDKAAFEAEAPEDGTLLAIFAEPGDAIPVLQNIAVIGEPGEDFGEFTPVEGEEAPEPEQGNVESDIMEQLPETDTIIEVPTLTGEVKISPRAKKTAEDLQINFSSIAGTGPEGRIIERDILDKAKETPKATPLAKSISYEDHVDLPVTGSGPQGKITAQDVKKSGTMAAGTSVTPIGDHEDKKISNIRRIIAENMHASLQNTAQLTLHSSADARKIKSLRKEFKKSAAEGSSPNITINDLVCYATVKALVKHPEPIHLPPPPL